MATIRLYPALHAGRDALVGIALFLTLLAKEQETNGNITVSELKKRYPQYCISKNRIDLTPDTDVDALLEKVKQLYKNEQIDTRDGVKIDFQHGWVHLRKSNTEPIIRIYSEAKDEQAANALAQEVIKEVEKQL